MKTPIWLWAVVTMLAGSGVANTQEPDLGTEEQRERGAVLYNKYCSQCHGVSGDGAGYAAPNLQPRPRDFTSGLFKLRTTPSGALPADEDLTSVIRNGMPHTSMIGWPEFTDKEVANVIYHIKSFSPNFEDSEYYDAPITIPDPPVLTNESVELGREIYTRMECFLCHGGSGRGDGTSAPELRDSAEYFIRTADLTKRWTFRGGPTRKDIYRTFSTGLNGTPMPSYADSLTNDERWNLVDYIYFLGDGDAPNYSDRLIAVSIEDAIDISKGEALFEQAPSVYFPLIGQIMEPGRAFHPAADAVELRAIHNGHDIAFMVNWHDMGPDLSGTNSPALEPPMPQTGLEDAQEPESSPEFDDGGFFDEAGVSEDTSEEDRDFFGEAVEPGPEEAIEDDFFGESAEDEDGPDDFFSMDQEEKTEEAALQESTFSDAMAIQFPSVLPQSLRLPYFIFGDLENSVDIWFADLAQNHAQRFIGRGSQSIAENDSGSLDIKATYQDGEWTVIFKQKLRSDSGVSFQEGQWMPIAFSVWDGWSEERGNHRALTPWFYVYIEPEETVSAIVPMAKAVLVVLCIEAVLIAVVRRKYKSNLPSI